jgi:hypothetical protein
MKKRYTITFNTDLSDIEEPLKEIEKLGVTVQSAQHFIGTAIVTADANQLKRVRSLGAIKGITETGTVKAM